MTTDPAAEPTDPDPVARHVTTPTEWTLARTLSEPTLGHDVALAVLASAFDGARVGELLERLDDAARPMFGVTRGGLVEQADAVGDVLTNRLGLRTCGQGHRSLLLGHVLAQRDAHPLLLAALGHELARRAGLTSVVARSGDECCCVLIRGGMALPVCFGRAPDPLDVSALRSCCPHELAFTILTAVARRAPSRQAAAAVRVRAALPIDWDLGDWSPAADV